MTLTGGNALTTSTVLLTNAYGGTNTWRLWTLPGHFSIAREGVDTDLEIDSSGVLFSRHKPVAVSPTAGNALTWDATGFYVASLEARVASLEAKLLSHTHQSGTVQNAGGTAIVL